MKEVVFVGNQQYDNYTKVAEYFNPIHVIVILPITSRYNADLYKASFMDNFYIYEIPMGIDSILIKAAKDYLDYYPEAIYMGKICDFKF